MDVVVYFDYCALFVLAMLLISCVFRKMLRGRVNVDYFWVVLVAFLTTIFDILTISMDNNRVDNYWARSLTHTAYLLLHSLNAPLYLIYLIDMTDTWHKIMHRKLTERIMFAPFVMVVVFLIVNFFDPIIFYFNRNGVYTRGIDFFVIYCCAAIYIGISLWYLISYRKLFSSGEFACIVCVFPIVAGAILVQMMVPELAIEMFAISVSLLFYGMMVMKPEDIVDSESGLMKKKAFTRDMHRAQISEKKVDIVLINIINYDTISNLLGYQGMNDLSKKLSDKFNSMKKNVNTKGELYHLGGGKFRLVAERRYTDRTSAYVLLLQNRLKEPFEFHHMDIDVVANICMAKWPEEISDVDSLLNFGTDLDSIPFSGELLYAKDVFKKDYYDVVRDIDAILEDAVAGKKFEVYYQPIYSVKDSKFISAEALIKLSDEKYGNISPEIFIPAAEKSGIVHKIGSYVLDEVCSFIGKKEFAELGLKYIEVNLSVAQCVESSLVEDMQERMKRYNITPANLNLEITETAVADAADIMEENLCKLYEAGFSFSLDDYGTGYSNIRRIAELPLSIVKMDKSFTGIKDNDKLKVIVENSVKMIKDMDMEIVVEGIESKEVLDEFVALGCDFIQGYYFSKPLTKQEFVNFLRKNNNPS